MNKTSKTIAKFSLLAPVLLSVNVGADLTLLVLMEYLEMLPCREHN